MKKRIFIVAATLLALILAFTSCSTPDAKTPTLLTVIEDTVTKEYEFGETPDFSLVKAVIAYDDGTAETVGADKLTFSSVDASTPGKKTVKVTYGSLTTEFQITINPPAPTVESISIVEGSVNLNATLGAIYEVSGIQIEVNYSDGSKRIVSGSDVEITVPDTSTVGEKTLTATYEGKSASVTVTVSGISSMEIVSGTLASTLFAGEALDTSRAQAIVYYDNGDSEIVSGAKLTVSELDSSSIGIKTVTVSYLGFEISYTVEVVGLVSIEIDSGSISSSVRIFDTLALDSLTATAFYSNGTRKTLTAKELAVTAPDTATLGKKTLTVKYGDMSATLEITVVGVESMTVISLNSEMLVNEPLNLSSIKVSVAYTDGTSEVVDYTKLTLGDFDSSVKGDATLSITYLDKTVEYAIRIFGVESLRVTGVDRVITAGEIPDLSKMKVYAVYGNTAKTELLLTEGYTTNISELDFTTEGQKTLVVSYSGIHGEFTESVIIDTEEPELVGIELRTYDKIIGIGQKYSKNNVTVIATYNNGSVETVRSDALSIESLSTDTAGEVTLSVSFTDGDITMTATASVKVLPIASMTVSGLPAMIDKGDGLDTSALNATVTYSDGEDTIINNVGISDGVTVVGFTSSSRGNVRLTVSYGGTSVYQYVFVREVSSVKIVGGYEKYAKYGYDVNTDNIQIEITYSNGDKETKLASDVGAIAVCQNTITENDYVTLTVGYKGVSDSLEIEVWKIDSISAINGTVPSSVIQGQSIDATKLKLSIYYKDLAGVTHLHLAGFGDKHLKIDGIDTTSPGEKAIIFTFIEGSEWTVPFTVTIKGISEITVVPGTLQTTLNVNQQLDTSELQLRVEFMDGSYIYVDRNEIFLTVGTIDTSTAGKKTLKISYLKFTVNVTITVADVSIGSNSIFGISSPDALVSRETYKKNFKKSNEVYVVGDDNPYRFYLNVFILDGGKLVSVDGRNVRTNARIYIIEDGKERILKDDELLSYVLVDSKNNTYDFTEAAIGKTFTLEVWPAENYSNAATLKHTVSVVDAYNVYTAKELHIITNYDADLNGNSMEGHLSQLAAVNKFLADNEIVRPATLSGIVIHNNIDITVKDIPNEYFYRGEFYDHLSVFYHVNTSSEKKFTMYGNYFSIFSYNLPCVVPNGVANNDDAFSSSELFRFRTNPGLFSTSFNHNDYETNIVNMAFRDNDPNSNDQAASERHMRGLICLKTSYQIVNIDNVNIDAYYLSMVPEDDNLTVNINDSKFYNAWQGHLFIWNNNYIQEKLDQEGHAPYQYYQPIMINITNSLIAKCGGPVILSQSDNRDFACNARSGAEIVVDEKSELYSYVTGQEAWFVAVGQTALAGQILAMDQLVSGTANAFGLPASYLSDGKITGVETVNMIFVNMGVGVMGTVGETYNGKITIAGTVGLNMTNNPARDAYVTATQQKAPVFQSSDGGTCFSYGDERGCLGIDFGTGATTYPDPSCFMGEYISLYYSGLGIMLEYYH